MIYEFQLVEKIDKQRALKQGLSVRVTCIYLNGKLLCRVFGRPDNDLLFWSEINKQIQELNKLTYLDLVKKKEYGAYTTKEVRRGQSEKGGDILNENGEKLRKKRRTKKEMQHAREVLQHS